MSRPNPQRERLRQNNRLDQRRVVVFDVADARANRPADHLIGRVGDEERFQLRLVGGFLCSAIFGSINSRRWAFSRSCVPSSSAPIRRDYPATLAARTAVSLRSTRPVAKAVLPPATTDQIIGSGGYLSGASPLITGAVEPVQLS